MVDILNMVNRSKQNFVQLCLPMEKAKDNAVVFPCYGSEKLDGVYVVAVYVDDVVRLYSRTGEAYVSMEHIADELEDFMNCLGVDVVIFEAYKRNTPQPTISGWARDKKKQHPELKAYIHDCMSFEEFAGREHTAFAERYARLSDVWTMVADDYSSLALVPERVYGDMESVMAEANDIWAVGGEGMVLRSMEACYHPGKRDASMVKVKKALSFDLQVVDVVEGQGKYEGAVGKLVCRDGAGKEIAVGTGLNDEERFTWLENPDMIIGKVVEIAAMAISPKGLLREPRFKGVRSDKLCADVIM